MEVRKAVIPAAGYGTRLYPTSKILKKELFPVVDLDGLVKPVIQIIIEEAIGAGIQEVCIVVREGDEQLFRSYFNAPVPSELSRRLSDRPWAHGASARLAELAGRITYIVQKEQMGFGHAVYCTEDWVGEEPFLLLLGDHIYMSNNELCCARQLINAFYQYPGNIFAVMRTLEGMLHLFGTVAGEFIDPVRRIYRVTEIKEKPTVEYAEMHLQSVGVPLGEYLCFFGQYVLMPCIFDRIKYLIENDIRERGEIQLTTALEAVQEAFPYSTYACEIRGQRYDIGVPISYANTVAAFVGHVQC